MAEPLIFKPSSGINVEVPVSRMDEFRWVINNYSICLFVTKSPTFTGLRTGRNWHLELLPHRIGGFSDGSIVLTLVLEHEEPSRPPIDILFKFFILNGTQGTAVSKGGKYTFDERNRFACTMIAQETVLNPMSGIPIDDRLTIVCRIAQQEQNINVIVSSKQEQLFESKAFSDCVLVCSDGILVPAWKNFLASQSAAFFAMFIDESTKEATTGRVDIIDAPSAVIQEMVRYTCCGKVEGFAELADDLFVVADKYGIDELKDVCAVELRASLSKDNVCHRVAMARLHNCGDLESAAFRFFKENARDIMQFKDSNVLFLRHPDLALEICAFLGQQICTVTQSER